MHAATRPQPTESTGTQSPDDTVPAASSALSGTKPTASVGAVRQVNPILRTDVGAQLHGCRITAADHELEQHVLDLDRQASEAYSRGDKDEALRMTRELMRAMARRRLEVVAAWEQDERLRIDDGAAFFASEQAQLMGRQVG